MSSKMIHLVALLLYAPVLALGFLPPLTSFGQTSPSSQQYDSYFNSATGSHSSPASSCSMTNPPTGRTQPRLDAPCRMAHTKLHMKRDEVPDENLRQMEAADQRVKEMEEEYWKSLDADELAVERKCASGLVCLKLGMLERAAEDYAAAAEKSRPSSRTWPLGLVLFYLGRYDEAAARLDTDIRSFETQFEESATDERIWQAAAIIRGAKETGADIAAVAATLPDLKIPEPNAVRRTAYEMFRGDASPEDLNAITRAEAGGVDFSGVDFFAELFMGLWHDAFGNEMEAETYILAACRNKFPQPDDLWYHTPRTHAKARGWSLTEE